MMYTVIGFWRDTEQRFMTSVQAADADHAEQKVGSANPGITLTGSITGNHKAADSEIYIQEFG